jgi:uncharacterized small protein (DUF1192 family)
MEDDDLPAGWIGSRGDAAHKLGLESLDRYSLDELDGRVGLLEAEIARVKAHRQKSAAHRIAAEALFRNITDGQAPQSSVT